MYENVLFPRDLDLTIEALRGMRGSMTGSYLVEAGGDTSVHVYCYQDDGSACRVDVAGAEGNIQVIQRTPEGLGISQNLGGPQASAADIIEAVAEVVDQFGTIVDVDDFEGDGEDWHDAIESFTDLVDAQVTTNA